eukprot:s271_g1.t1
MLRRHGSLAAKNVMLASLCRCADNQFVKVGPSANQWLSSDLVMLYPTDYASFRFAVESRGRLPQKAQKIQSLSTFWLVTAEGRVLNDPEKSLEAAGLSEGDHLTAIAQQGKLSATKEAFAFWSPGGDKILTWGHPKVTGRWAVQNKLGAVRTVRGNGFVGGLPEEDLDDGVGAFAAILEDGSVVAWGDQDCGGDSSEVQHQLVNVKQLEATGYAFAAILADGSVVTWGERDWGGDSLQVQDQLRDVRQIAATDFAFAAILADGSVVTWGDLDCGGDSSRVQSELRKVQQIQGSAHSFAAVLEDGSVVTWGERDLGGDSSEVQDQLKSVKQIQAACTAFAAILEDGSVIAWGHPAGGGDSSEVQHQLRNVQQVQSTASAFAAILANGSVVTWGDPDHGGDSSEVQHQLRHVQQIQATSDAFAAVLEDGSVVTWGASNRGGDSSKVQDRLRNVQQIQATAGAFAAILSNDALEQKVARSKAGEAKRQPAYQQVIQKADAAAVPLVYEFSGNRAPEDSWRRPTAQNFGSRSLERRFRGPLVTRLANSWQKCHCLLQPWVQVDRDNKRPLIDMGIQPLRAELNARGKGLAQT